jgi:hypothetical protein
MGRTDAIPARHRFVLYRVKVIRIAIEHAVSVAGVLLLTEATLTEVPDAKPDAREPGGVEKGDDTGDHVENANDYDDSDETIVRPHVDCLDPYRRGAARDPCGDGRVFQVSSGLVAVRGSRIARGEWPCVSTIESMRADSWRPR